MGKGVLKAVANISDVILAPALVGKDATAQAAVDQIMLDLDATESKTNLGANAILDRQRQGSRSARGAPAPDGFLERVASKSGRKAGTKP